MTFTHSNNVFITYDTIHTFGDFFLPKPLEGSAIIIVVISYLCFLHPASFTLKHVSFCTRPMLRFFSPLPRLFWVLSPSAKLMRKVQCILKSEDVCWGSADLVESDKLYYSIKFEATFQKVPIFLKPWALNSEPREQEWSNWLSIIKVLINICSIGRHFSLFVAYHIGEGELFICECWKGVYLKTIELYKLSQDLQLFWFALATTCYPLRKLLKRKQSTESRENTIAFIPFFDLVACLIGANKEL
jgi:hypothetical protein